MTNKKCNDKITKPQIFTDDEKNNYIKNRYKMFKGTISICVAYVIIAIILIIASYSTSLGSSIFTELMPFMMIFIIGSIGIMIYFAVKVYKYKPTSQPPTIYKSDICPDYWSLEYVDDENNVRTADDADKTKFMKKCVLPADGPITRSLLKKGDPNEFKVSNGGTTQNDWNLNNKNYHIYKEYNPITYIPPSTIAAEDKVAFKNSFTDAIMTMNKYKKKTDTTDGSIKYNFTSAYNDPIDGENGTAATGNTTSILDRVEEKYYDIDENTGAYTKKNDITDYTNLPKLYELDNAFLLDKDGGILGDDTGTGLEYTLYKYTGTDTFSPNNGVIAKCAAGGDSCKNGAATTPLPIVCDTVYPDYLADLDRQYVEDHPEVKENNIFRCEYAKKCGVTWTGLNCKD